MRIALIHDFLTRHGGAERVLAAFHKMFPEAPIYVLLFDEKMKRYFPNAEIRPSFLQKFPAFLRRRPKFFAPLCPTAAETFDLRDFDLVISSSSAFAKGAITRSRAIHICYCHSPMRYVHDYYRDYLGDLGGSFLRWPAKIAAHYLRIWDKSSADRVDYFIANSNATAQRIKKYYRKDSTVVYPPVAVSGFSGGVSGDYFLVISQLAPYKRIDVAVKAFNELNLPLVVIGDGPDRKRLEKMAKSNAKFFGWLGEEEKWNYLKNCRALIFPGEDDFGITAVEAMSCGKPVLAFRAGGVLETVVEDETGEFFSSPDELAERVVRFAAGKYDAEKIAARSAAFSEERFEREIKDFIESKFNCSNF